MKYRHRSRQVSLEFWILLLDWRWLVVMALWLMDTLLYFKSLFQYTFLIPLILFSLHKCYSSWNLHSTFSVASADQWFHWAVCVLPFISVHVACKLSLFSYLSISPFPSTLPPPSDPDCASLSRWKQHYDTRNKLLLSDAHRGPLLHNLHLPLMQWRFNSQIGDPDCRSEGRLTSALHLGQRILISLFPTSSQVAARPGEM